MAEATPTPEPNADASAEAPSEAVTPTEAVAPTEAATPSEPVTPGEAETTLGNPGDDEGSKVPADWPEDWRERMAAATVGKSEGEDYDKELARLKRFKTAGNVFKSLRDLERLKSQGKLKEDNPFPADGTDDDKAAWRKEAGLPESADGYLQGLPEGLVVGEDDKDLVGRFLEHAHNEGGSQAEVNRALSAYYEIKESQAAEQSKLDKTAKIETEEALRAELGPEFRPTMQSIMGFLDGAPEGVKDAILQGRMADGTPIASHANTLRWLANLTAELNPAATVVGSNSGNAMQTLESEIAEIEGLMRNTTSDYHVGPKSAGLKARYRQLIEARDKIKSRAA